MSKNKSKIDQNWTKLLLNNQEKKQETGNK